MRLLPLLAVAPLIALVSGAPAAEKDTRVYEIRVSTPRRASSTRSTTGSKTTR